MFDKDLDGVCEYEYLLPIENDDINSILEKYELDDLYQLDASTRVCAEEIIDNLNK